MKYLRVPATHTHTHFKKTFIKCFQLFTNVDTCNHICHNTEINSHTHIKRKIKTPKTVAVAIIL